MYSVLLLDLFDREREFTYDWQSKGHRFDSDILHFDYQDFTAM